MNINQYLEDHRIVRKAGRNYQFLELRPEVVCADGFRMSVQASHAHYCSPREDSGPYRSVEIGFPSGQDDALMPFAEDADNPTGTVYGYVPVDIVDALIERHGGFVNRGGSN